MREEVASKVILSAVPTFSVGTESKDVDYVLMDTATPPARRNVSYVGGFDVALTQYLHKREQLG